MLHKKLLCSKFIAELKNLLGVYLMFWSFIKFLFNAFAPLNSHSFQQQTWIALQYDTLWSGSMKLSYFLILLKYFPIPLNIISLKKI